MLTMKRTLLVVAFLRVQAPCLERQVLGDYLQITDELVHVNPHLQSFLFWCRGLHTPVPQAVHTHVDPRGPHGQEQE